MRPLVLREIADELGPHESTISRVTTAKYMSTPFGTFELKYFFGSGLGTESGGTLPAQRCVRSSNNSLPPKIRTNPQRQPDRRHAQSRASTAPAAPWPSTAKGSKIAVASLQRRCSGAAARKAFHEPTPTLFLPALWVEDLCSRSPRAHGLYKARICFIRRGGVVAHTSWRDALRSEPAQPPGAAGAGATVVAGEYRSEQDLNCAAHAVAWEIWFTPRQTIKVEVTAQHSPLQSLNFCRAQDHGCRLRPFPRHGRRACPASIPTGRMCASSRTHHRHLFALH